MPYNKEWNNRVWLISYNDTKGSCILKEWSVLRLPGKCTRKWTRKLSFCEKDTCVSCNTPEITRKRILTTLLKWALQWRFYATGPRPDVPTGNSQTIKPNKTGLLTSHTSLGINWEKEEKKNSTICNSKHTLRGQIRQQNQTLKEVM